MQIAPVASAPLWPQDLTSVNGTLFFVAPDGPYEYLLYKSDGTASGTVAISPPIGVDTTAELTNVNGTLFFVADESLWETNGTLAGTHQLQAIVGGGRQSIIRNLTNVDGTLYFSALDQNGIQLWKSDGTSAGTVRLSDIGSGVNGTDLSPAFLTNYDGTLFFTGSDGTSHGVGLWKSDGTSTGTVMVKDFGSSGVFRSDGLTNAGGTLFFGTLGSVLQLWRSDGTTAGTVPIETGTSPGSIPAIGFGSVGGTFYFGGSDGVHGDELWASDGTPAGTGMVKDIYPGAHDSDPYGFVNVSGTLYFAAGSPRVGFQVWRSDGTASGTQMLKDVEPTGGAEFGASPRDLTNVNGTLFFSAADQAHSDQLWESDGTSGGTVRVSDLYDTTPNGLAPDEITPVGDKLFFIGYNADFNEILYSAVLPGSETISVSGSSGMTFVLTGDGALSSKQNGQTVTIGAPGTIQSISQAVASSAGNGMPAQVVLYAVTTDGGLARYGSLTGWQRLGAAGTIDSVSAGADAAGQADAYVITAGRALTEWRDARGWLASPIGAPNTIASMNAAANGAVVVLTAGHAVYQYESVHGWAGLSADGFAQSVSAVTDNSGQMVVYAVTSTGTLLQDDAGVWKADGNFIVTAAAGTSTAGQACVYAVTQKGDLFQLGQASGWQNLNEPASIATLTPMASDQVFAVTEDHAAYEYTAGSGWLPIT